MHHWWDDAALRGPLGVSHSLCRGRECLLATVRNSIVALPIAWRLIPKMYLTLLQDLFGAAYRRLDRGGLFFASLPSRVRGPSRLRAAPYTVTESSIVSPMRMEPAFIGSSRSRR